MRHRDTVVLGEDYHREVQGSARASQGAESKAESASSSDEQLKPEFVPAVKNDAGAVAFDDGGRARWKWKTEAEHECTEEDTFSYVKALENSSLSVDEPPEEDSKAFKPYGSSNS